MADGVWCQCLISTCFCFKQKTAYELRISDWSSDVCSSDLLAVEACENLLRVARTQLFTPGGLRGARISAEDQNGVDRQLDLLSLSVARLLRRSSCGDYADVAVRQSVKSRSEERRVGKEGVSTVKSRWSPYH